MTTETKQAPPKARHTIDKIMEIANTTPFQQWANVLNETEMGLLRKAMMVAGVIKVTAYTPQPLDGFITELKSSDSPDAKDLLQAIADVIALAPSFVDAGHCFDLRFDQRGFGYCKMTAQYRKLTQKDGTEKTQLVPEFKEYKGLPTLELSKSV